MLEGALHLPGSRTKNKRAHAVPLSAPAREVLAELPIIEDCPYALTTTTLRPPGVVADSVLVRSAIGG